MPALVGGLGRDPQIRRGKGHRVRYWNVSEPSLFDLRVEIDKDCRQACGSQERHLQLPCYYSRRTDPPHPPEDVDGERW